MTEQTQDHSKDTLPPTEPRAGGRAIGVLFAFIIVAGIVGYTILSRQERAVQPPTVSTSGAGHGLNVLLITVDSLRPDFLGCYGGAGAETPAIDALASNGVRFAHAVTAVPITRPSIATILTGLNPPRHGVRDDGPYPLADAHETLAETLKSAGYATAAFVGSFLLDARYGLNQGFDVYDDDMVGGLRSGTSRFDTPHRRGHKVVDAALDWLDQFNERNTTMPFFLWVDLFDAQSSFAPTEPFVSRYPRQPYRRKVAFVDHQIGRITDALRERSLEDRTLVLLVGTHGHARGEHHEDGHGLLLYESTVAVPMIWHCPPLLGEPRVDDQHLAATVDVVPGVLNLLGIPPGQPRDGTDMIHNPRQADEAVYMETLAPRLRHGWSPLFAYRRLTDKVIHAPTPEYYQLGDDPGERKNIFDEATVRAKELHSALQKHLDSLGDAAVAAATDLTPFADTLNQLTGMGYRLSEEESAPRVFLDPKLIMPSFDQLQIAVFLLKTGRLAESGGRFEAVAQSSPYDGVVWGEFGKALVRMGAFGDALEAELKAVHYQPRARHWVELAELLAREHDLAAMDVALEQMGALDPNDGGIWLVRGKSAAAQGRHDEALEHFAHARRSDPARSSADAYALAGDVHRAQGQLDQAKEAYELALTFDAKHVIALEGLAGLAQMEGNMAAQINYMQQLANARPGTILYVNTLAKLYMRVDRGEDAIQLMERYVAQNPDNVAALGNLGNTYSEMNHFKKAVDTYRRAIEMAPDYPIPRFNLGDALARLDDPDGAIKQYRKVLELIPTHTTTYLRLIKTLMGEDRLDEAFEVLEQAVARSDIKEEMLAHDDAMAPLVGSPRFRELFSQRRQPNP